MEWFQVFIATRHDRTTEIARTRYESDAHHILRSKHAGFIKYRGQIIFRKNVDLKENNNGS